MHSWYNYYINVPFLLSCLTVVRNFTITNVAAIFPCSDWGLTKGNIVNMEVTPSKNNNGGGKESRKVGGREGSSLHEVSPLMIR